ncbi:MFS transporter [Nitratireductor aquibiodomus]|uniref:MFS transporter n=1 Tax=Nitratireductor aquibiodomus TaxID=204799 RepID=UPI003A5C6BEC
MGDRLRGCLRRPAKLDDESSPSAIEVATALFVSIFNISIALGSLAGGQIVDRFGLQTNLLLAAVLPVLGLIFAIAIHRHSMSIASRPAEAPTVIR